MKGILLIAILFCSNCYGQKKLVFYSTVTLTGKIVERTMTDRISGRKYKKLVFVTPEKYTLICNDSPDDCYTQKKVNVFSLYSFKNDNLDKAVQRNKNFTVRVVGKLIGAASMHYPLDSNIEVISIITLPTNK